MALPRILGGSLRRLLQRGFERIVAHATNLLLPRDLLSTFIATREPGLTDTEIEALAQHIRDGQIAADQVGRLRPNDPIPLDEFPENPELFGRAAHGDRWHVDVDVDIITPDGEVVRQIGQITVRESSELTLSEMLAAIHRAALDIFLRSPRGELKFADEDFESRVTRWAFAQKRF